MTSSYSVINLSRSNPPELIEQKTQAELLAEMIASFESEYPEHEGLTQADPMWKVLNHCAYYRMLDRQEFQYYATQLLLPFAKGTFLDVLAKNIDPDLERQIITPADPDAIPPVEEVLESDDDFLQRILIACEKLSVAGPDGAYIGHALDVAGVKDAKVKATSAGQVLLTVLSDTGDGTASAELQGDVEDYLADKIPFTDTLTVQSATIVDYTIEANLIVFEGPSLATIAEQAETAVKTYRDNAHRVGRKITLSGLMSALSVEGVYEVELTTPSANVDVTDEQAAYCTDGDITITAEYYNELST